MNTSPSHPATRWLIATALLGLAVVGGCRWTGRSLFRPPGPAAPVVIESTATADQIVAAVNQNTARVQTYSTNTAKFTVPGLAGIPVMRGNIHFQRPRNFRLTAGLAVTGGHEIDLGSNDELFWFWVKRNSPPALFYCRHDQFANSGARQVLPVDPTWIGDALGLVQLDPAATYEGPVRRPDGTLELRTTVSTPAGPMTRAIVVDATRAWVLEQHLYAPSGGAPVASAVATDFRYEEQAQVSLPREVTVRVPASDLALSIDVGQVAINQPIHNAAAMWSLPTLEGYPQVDLGATSPDMPVDTSGIPTAATRPPVAPRRRPELAAAPARSFAPSGTVSPARHTTEPVATAVHRLPAGGIVLDGR